MCKRPLDCFVARAPRNDEFAHRQTPPVPTPHFWRGSLTRSFESLSHHAESKNGFPVFRLTSQRPEKGSGTPASPGSTYRIVCGCGDAHITVRADLSAFHLRLSPEGLPVPKAQVQARLPGTWFHRALPSVSCPSPVAAPHAPVVMPASMMPEPARERSVSLRPQAPHPLHLG